MAIWTRAITGLGSVLSLRRIGRRAVVLLWPMQGQQMQTQNGLKVDLTGIGAEELHTMDTAVVVVAAVGEDTQEGLLGSQREEDNRTCPCDAVALVVEREGRRGSV